MPERIVVSCRMNGEEASRPGSRYLQRARALTQRAEALGATLASWSATTLAFSFDVESLDEVIDLAAEAARGRAPNDANEPSERWAIAIARGEMEPLAETGGGRADLAWGDALVSAVVLARAAWPGEVLVEATFADVDAFVTTGKRAARDGERRVRGVRIDPRQPWKKDAAASVTRVQTPALLPRGDVRALLAHPGALNVVRADPGHGGSRTLAELARAASPAAALLVTPIGASVEPLGALRRALVRILSSRAQPGDPVFAPATGGFLAGAGTSLEHATAILTSILVPPGAGQPAGVLILDDAAEIDAETLEVCAHAAKAAAGMGAPFHLVARIDATDPPPVALSPLARGAELELGPLGKEEAEALARSATGGALDALAARRIARRASYVPLAIVEALALALGRGDVAWIGGAATLRGRASFAGKPAKAGYWIAKRAKATSPDEKGVLAAIALLGGEATRAIVAGTLQHVDPAIDAEAACASLVAKRWLVESQPGWVSLPSRTHKDTIAELLDELPKRAVSRAIADVLGAGEGEIACAEAAHHAIMAGEGERGARLALRAARAAAVAGMPASANRLLTLARLADPKAEAQARQQLFTSLPQPAPPPPPASRPKAPLPPLPPPPPTPPAARSAPAPYEDAPTERVSPMNAAQASGLLEAYDDGDRDSDFPTVIKLNPLERPTDPNPMPAYARAPPPPPPVSAAPPAPEDQTLRLPALPNPPLPPPPRATPPRPGPSAPRPSTPAVSPPRSAPRPASVAPPAGELNAVATRMIDLAKSALLGGDAAAVDRWTEGLRAAGDHDRVAERIGAIARLSRGEIGEAIRSLRALASESPPSSRAQASLALGVALAAANRPEEALLAALEALARAREGTDARAAGACLAFLAKLYAHEGRSEAEALRAALAAKA